MNRVIQVARLFQRSIAFLPRKQQGCTGHFQNHTRGGSYGTSRCFSSSSSTTGVYGDSRIPIGNASFDVSVLQSVQKFSSDGPLSDPGLFLVATDHVRNTKEFSGKQSQDAGYWLLEKDTEVRAFVRNLQKHNAALHPDMRICQIGTIEELINIPWECSIVLLSTKFIEKDTMIASIPQSLCTRSRLVSKDPGVLLKNTNVPMCEVTAAVSLSDMGGKIKRIKNTLPSVFPLKYNQGEQKSPDHSFNEDLIELYNTSQVSPAVVLQKHPEWNAGTVLHSLIYSKVIPIEETLRGLTDSNSEYLYNMLETILVHRKHQPINVYSRNRMEDQKRAEEQGNSTILSYQDYQYQVPVPASHQLDQPAYLGLVTQIEETMTHQSQNSPHSGVQDYLGKIVEVPSYVSHLLDDTVDSETASFFTVPYLDQMKPVVRPTSRNVSLQYGVDEDEEGNAIAVIQAISRGDVVPFTNLTVQWATAMLPRYTGVIDQEQEQVEHTWGGVEPTTEQEMSSNTDVPANLIPDFRLVSLSEALLCFGEAVSGAADLKVDADALFMRQSSVKRSIYHWHQDCVDKQVPISTEFTHNDVNGWKRVVGPAHAAKLVFGSDKGLDSLITLHTNKHIALEAGETALGLFTKLHLDYDQDIPHQSQLQPDAMKRYHRAAVTIIKYTYPALFASAEIKSCDVRMKTREVQRAKTIGSVIAFTGCSLQQDIGRAIFGASIPSISMNILQTLEQEPLWGTEQGNRDILTGALPSYETVTNEYRNSTRRDQQIVQGYIKTVSKAQHTLQQEHPTQYKPQKMELQEILVQLKGARLATETRFQLLMLWRNLYAYAYRQYMQTLQL